MADENVPVVEAELSFADLRKMMESDFAETPVVETPAAAAEEPVAKTAPATEPEKKQEPEAKSEEAIPAGVQKRIDKAIAKQREAERRADAAEARLSQQPQAAEPAKPTTETVKPTGKPDATKFTDWDAYQEALIDWKADQRDQARAEAQQKQATEQRGKELTASWAESESDAKEAHPDYADVMKGVDHIKVPQHLQLAILESDDKAELAYALAKSPADVERISKLPAAKALVELGRFAAKLEAKAAPTPKPVAAALPKPPAVVGGASAAAPAIDLDTCDFTAFKKEFGKRYSR